MFSGTNLFLSLFNNLAIFIILIHLYGSLEKIVFRHFLIRQVLMGILFGVSALACMLVHIPVWEGVYVDQRNTVVVLSSLFGGPVSGLITAIVTAINRIYIGGRGVPGGIVGISLSFAAGTILRYFRKRHKGIFFYFWGALFSTIMILPGFLVIGDFKSGLELLGRMVLPYGLAVFLGISLVAILLEREINLNKSQSLIISSERRYRQLYENLLDISYQTDANGCLTMVSPSIEKISGYSPEEIIGKQISFFYLDPEYRAKFMNELNKKGIVENFQAEMIKKDNSRIWISTNARSILNDKGNFIGVEGIARDISAQKKAEKEKQELENILMQTQKMEAVGTLAGGIAHDYNNILSVILGYTELVKDSVTNDSQLQKYLNTVLSAIERGKDLTTQILTFSRKMETEKKKLPIAKVIHEAVDLLRQTLPSTVCLVTNIDDKTGIVLANKTQINQIVVNLVTNSFHAFPSEKGTITVNLSSIALLGQSEEYPNLPSGRYSLLSVQDTGSGIDKEILSRIFEPFFTTKEKEKGTGLGLSVVHGIILDHAGGVNVKSVIGEGTTFDILLPLVPDEQEENNQIIINESDLRGSERILIVDDEKELVNVLEKNLKSLGYRVTSVYKPEEAFRLFRRELYSFDLLITDQTMPKMTGLELSAEILAVRQEMPIIITTGYSSVLDISEAKKMGIQHIIMKPIYKNDLALVIRKIFDRNILSY